MTPLQTKQQIAAWAGVSLRTVQGWAADGCPHIRIGRVLRFEVDEVRGWLMTRDEAAPTPRSLRAVRAVSR